MWRAQLLQGQLGSISRSSLAAATAQPESTEESRVGQIARLAAHIESTEHVNSTLLPQKAGWCECTRGFMCHSSVTLMDLQVFEMEDEYKAAENVA